MRSRFIFAFFIALAALGFKYHSDRDRNASQSPPPVSEDPVPGEVIVAKVPPEVPWSKKISPRR